jgi:hypothetical protein
MRRFYVESWNLAGALRLPNAGLLKLFWSNASSTSYRKGCGKPLPELAA